MLCSKKKKKTGFKRTFLWKLPVLEEWFGWRLRLNISVIQLLVRHLFTFKSVILKREAPPATWYVLGSCVPVKACPDWSLSFFPCGSSISTNTFKCLPGIIDEDIITVEARLIPVPSSSGSRWWYYSCSSQLRTRHQTYWDCESKVVAASRCCCHLCALHGCQLSATSVLKGLEKISHFVFEIILRSKCYYF